MPQPSRPVVAESAFPPAADATRYFPGGASEQCRKRIARAIARDEGPALLVGTGGSGKTMLLEVLRHQFHDAYDVVPVVGSQIGGRGDLLRTVLFRLGLPYQGVEEGELRLAIVDRLQREKPSASKMVLLVDEADLLPVEVLEELRALTNIVRDGRPMVSLVMAGGPVMEERLSDPRVAAFAQRIASRTYLKALGRGETLQYIRAHVEAVGIELADLLTEDATEAVWQATAGLPRLVNQLCDQVIWEASENGQTPADAAAVERAWCEIQQIPVPDTGVEAAASEAVVEFGELDSSAVLLPEDTFVGLDDRGGEEGPASIPFVPAAAPSRQEIADTEFDEEHVVVEAEQSLADDPFAEQFEEEVHLDVPYVDAARRKSPYDDFPRIEVGAPASSPSKGGRHPLAVDPAAEGVVVLEEEPLVPARVVPGRQFRDLFSRLENGRRLPRSG